MVESRAGPIVRISNRAQANLIAAATDAAPVQGLTHNFYKYPARFSPSFVRSAISAFTQPGDLVVDNHVGGGTTVVEAIAAGRDAIGIDISTLAEFVTRVKTTMYSDADLARLKTWSLRSVEAIHQRKAAIHFEAYADAGYYRHLTDPSRWRIRKAIEQALGSAMSIGNKRLEAFARCAILRSAQLALDGRASLPSIAMFRGILAKTAADMLDGALALRVAIESTGRVPVAKILNRSAAGADKVPGLWSTPPRLVLTSPPYPGVHVLYHRWQVDGRKETPAPFWIAGALDGAGASHYTMGDRKESELVTYFSAIKESMSAVARVADSRTVFVQVVAFSDAGWQLRRYLEAMEAIGLREAYLLSLVGEGDGRLWRTVPNRRWYSIQRGDTSSAREVVLFHRKATRASLRIAAHPDHSPVGALGRLR